MSTDFRATQMQAGKYIRFVSTQDLRTRAMSAKRRHHRIIARTRTHNRSLASVLSQGAWPNLGANSWARCAHTRRSAHADADLRSSLIFPTSPRIERHELAQVLVARNKPEAASDGVTSERLADAGVSTRNAAHSVRDRIFLHRRQHIFVVNTLEPRTTALETRRKSSDSAQVSVMRPRLGTSYHSSP